MNTPVKWPGVRPIRYHSEVFAVLELVASKPCDLESIRLVLVKERQKREKVRLNTLLTMLGTKNSRRIKADFETKSEQLIRFLRRIGLVESSSGMISASSQCRELVTLLHIDPIAAQARYLRLVLNSPFSTYLDFLVALRANPLSIPKKELLSYRGKEIGKFLAQRGFPLDSWSFFVLRDFFYDLGLVDHVYKPTEEHIFPLYRFGEHVEGYKLKVEARGNTLNYWPDVRIQDFVEILTQAYLAIGGSWSRIVDLVELRERISEERRIPDVEFNLLLKRVMSEHHDLVISLSFGSLRMKPRRGYYSKVITLPIHSSGQPYTLIRIERRVK